MRKENKPPGTSLSLGNTAKVTKNMLPARATEKSWLKKSQTEHEFYLLQRPYILDVLERAYKNKKRGGFVHLKCRGMGVFSRVSHSFSPTAPALAHCQIVKKKLKRRRKETQTNKQTTNNKNKEKEKRLWTSYMNNGNLAIFSSFFLLDGICALFRLRSYRKGQKGHL